MSHFFNFGPLPLPRYYNYENRVKIVWKMNSVTLKRLYWCLHCIFRTFLTLTLAPCVTVLNLGVTLYENWFRDLEYLTADISVEFVNSLLNRKYTSQYCLPNQWNTKTLISHVWCPRGEGEVGQKLPGMKDYGSRESSACKIWIPIFKISWSEKNIKKLLVTS